MIKKIFLLSLVVVMLSLAACQKNGGGAAAPQSTPELRQAVSSGKKTLVFFLNPEGGPCRAQDEILRKLHADRGGNFNVTYISALKTEDQQAFYDYGVRNLPSLVLLDSRGRIGHVFSPGIQTYEAMAQALDSSK